MSLRTRFTEELKASMLAGNAARTSTLRMIMAKLKDTDIAARKTPQDPGVPAEQIVSMLRGMAKSRAEAVTLYRQGNRPELAAKEEAEIAVIEGFLPQQMDEASTEAAVTAAIAETGAASIKDMGKVMAALRAKHAAGARHGQGRADREGEAKGAPGDTHTAASAGTHLWRGAAPVPGRIPVLAGVGVRRPHPGAGYPRPSRSRG